MTRGSTVLQQRLMTNQQIIIVGFMGSGKTTVAWEVGQRLNWAVIDLDDFITSSEGRSPAEIIEQDGENSFREIETQVLGKVLSNNSRVVIAAGGGVWTVGENRRLIAKQGALTVWLDAPFELCWDRIQVKREMRPLAPSEEVAKRLYRDRRPVYESADLRIPVAENDSVEEIAERIVDGLATNR
jgi:shikimate kinase